MKQRITIHFYNSLISFFLLWTCTNCSTNPTDTTPVHHDSILKEYYINDGKNQMLATIVLENEETNLRIGNNFFIGEPTSSNKRKYYNQADHFVYAVKYNDNGFKLYDESERLCWKVKIYSGYIKIADNESMSDYFRIAWYDGGVIKIKQNETLVKECKSVVEANNIILDQKYILHNFEKHFSTAVLLLDQLPPQERFLICAELLRLAK